MARHILFRRPCVFAAFLLAVAPAQWAAQPTANPPGTAEEEPLDPDTVRKVRKLLKGSLEEDDAAREKSSKGLAEMGNLATRAFLELLKDPATDETLTAQIILFLAGTKDGRAGPALVELLGHKALHVRRLAARSLGDVPYPEGAAGLRKIYEDGAADEELRLFAAVSGAKQKSAEAFEALKGLLKSKSAFVRGRAAFALTRYGQGRKGLVEAITPLLSDPEAVVRADAVTALRQAGGREILAPLAKAALDADREVRQAARDLIRGAKDAFPTLVESLAHPDAEVRKAVAELVGEMGLELGAKVLKIKPENLPPALPETPGDETLRKAAAALTARYMDVKEEEGVRVAAARAAWRLGGKEAAPALRDLLRAVTAAARREAAETLARLGGGKEAANLLPLLKDASLEVRDAVILALARIRGPVACEGLVQALSDRDATLRAAALEALKSLSGEELGEDPQVWREWLERTFNPRKDANP